MLFKKILISLSIVILMLVQSVFAMEETVNVAFTIDKNYPIFTLLAINSILKNNVSNFNYMFYIIETNIPNRDKKMMQKYVEKRGQQISFININTDTLDQGNDFFGENTPWHGRLNSISLARILLADYLPQNVNKVLYLDGDILVLKDLKLLYDVNLNGKAVGMCDNQLVPEYKMYKFISLATIGKM